MAEEPTTTGPPVSKPGLGLVHWVLGGAGLLGLPILMSSWSKYHRNRNGPNAAVFHSGYEEVALLALAVGAAWMLAAAVDWRLLRRAWAWDMGAVATAGLGMHLYLDPPTEEFGWSGLGAFMVMLILVIVAGSVALAAWPAARRDARLRTPRSLALHAFGATSLSAPLWILTFARQI